MTEKIKLMGMDFKDHYFYKSQFIDCEDYQNLTFSEYCPNSLLRYRDEDGTIGEFYTQYSASGLRAMFTEPDDSKIKITKSNTADTRSCDWSKVSKEDLFKASMTHIKDVRKGIAFLIEKLDAIAFKHDHTKIEQIDGFQADFTTGFKNTTWWEMHQKTERHHFNNPDAIQDDINLLDVLEQIVDGVMAGLARTGEYRFEPLADELLQKAYRNTANFLIKHIEVEE